MIPWEGSSEVGKVPNFGTPKGCVGAIKVWRRLKKGRGSFSPKISSKNLNFLGSFFSKRQITDTTHVLRNFEKWKLNRCNERLITLPKMTPLTTRKHSLPWNLTNEIQTKKYGKKLTLTHQTYWRTVRWTFRNNHYSAKSRLSLKSSHCP